MSHRIVAVVALALATAFAISSPSAAQETASISGSVFHDLDENGVRDEGEPGLPRTVTLLRDDAEIDSDANPDGTYSFEELEPGAYTVRATLDESFGVTCLPGPATFDPLRIACTRFYTIQWHATTPETVEVTLDAGDEPTVDFGARRADTLIVDGTAILHDDYAPAGTPLTALYNGIPCGQGFVNSDGIFQLEIAGAGETGGCAPDGGRVEFRVGGVGVIADMTWRTGKETEVHHLLAMPDHAWFWLEVPSLSGEAAIGQDAVAVVGGNACGAAAIGEIGIGTEKVIGFKQLIVARETLESGCGTDGGNISFQIGGKEFATAEWATGVHQLEAESLPGPTVLPPTGGSPVGGNDRLPLALAAALTLAGFVATGVGLRRVRA